MKSYRLICISVFILCAVFHTGQAQGVKGTDLIRLNQVGFYPKAPKKAIIEKDTGGNFYLLSEDKQDTLFTGVLSESVRHIHGDRLVTAADFSSFSEPGTYRLLIPGVGYSHPFEIKAGVHSTAAKALIKGFYYQRASTALPERYAGKWHRAYGHPDDSVLVHASAATESRPEGTVIRSPWGWYDAGDYNKYVVNSGITMGTLLSLYEDFPSFVQNISLNIPESGNKIPDLLDEILWNLRWMLTMQDPGDGGVYHKMTFPNFTGMVMPEQGTGLRYVVQKSTAATLDFAAVMAQAARVFAKYEKQLPGLADSCLVASKKAWEWSRKNQEVIYNQWKLNINFDPDITTGAYGDRNLQDEFIWAAAELYVTTKDDSYADAVEFTPGDNIMTLPSWGDVRGLAYYTLLRFKDELKHEIGEEILKIEEMVLDFSDKLVEGGMQSAYRTVMGMSENNFVWGSNAVAANQAIALVQAYHISDDKNYIDYALSNMDYLMGRNGTGFAFVTGHGDKSPMHPHHRPSAADEVEEPVPGLLVGGPNPSQQDPCSYPTDVADQSYVDEECSYASNEVAINWNAPMVYLAGSLEALQYKVGYSEK